MSNPILASIQSYACVAGAGAFSGGMLSFFCKTKMKEMVVLGAVLNLVEKFFADLAINCILRNPLAAANPAATTQKVLAVRLGGTFLSIAILVVAVLVFRHQKRQARTNVLV